MRRGVGALGAMCLVVLVAGMCWAGASIDETNSGDDPQWTFIYYLAADNDQELYADNTIAQLIAGYQQGCRIIRRSWSCLIDFPPTERRCLRLQAGRKYR